MMKTRKSLLIRNIIILVVSVIFLVGGSACVYADQLLNKINFVQPDSSAGPEKLFETGNTSTGEKTNAKAGLIGGLYHDDAVTNILMLGTDDYQDNDVGRSDSLMLVSVDTRHNKLKITSFLRDMYLAIPGIGSYKLNEAYSRSGGRINGAKKVVSTIEANFGVDIDRFVIVDFSAFPKIIDRLGGVQVQLSNEKNADGFTEAGLINAYSGETKQQVKPGVVNNLTGLQARYYARIREIGNDQERTERQRKVFYSLVSKLKTSNVMTLNSMLVDVLPLVTTNMTKNEVLSMAANSLTYLNYPVSQHRVPEEGEYWDVRDAEGNWKWLGVDLEKCRKSFAEFLFEKDIPSGNYSG